MSFYDTHMSFDFETSGSKPEYALQPWRIPSGNAWATSLVWLTYSTKKKEAVVCGGLNPTKGMMELMLRDALHNNKRIVGWNVLFDISVLIAYGLEDLVMKCRWLDGMHVWRHAEIEPEYDTNRPSKKHYGLKGMVAQLWPEHAGYGDDIDFHDPDPVVRAKLHHYNIRDCIFTLRGCKHYWDKLTDRQQRTALIEAECLPQIAGANYRGLLVDTLHLNSLRKKLEKDAAKALKDLAPLGMTEAIIRSPIKLRKLMFVDWGLTPLKTTTTNQASTDKETLHELAIYDDRVKLVREYRNALNSISKFVDTPLKAAAYNGDGCARPQGIVFGTYTGRMTYSSNQSEKKKQPPSLPYVAPQPRGPAIAPVEGYDDDIPF